MRAVFRPGRAIARALQALAFEARQPSVHRLPTHIPLARDLANRLTVRDDSLNRFVALLSHAHLRHGRGVSRR